MKKNILIGILIITVLFLTINIFAIQKYITEIHNTTIGELVTAKVENNRISFTSRVDSGAETTSIHAENIKIKNKSDVFEKNIGKDISFTLINNIGEKTILTKEIKDVRTVKNAEKKEERYYVEMQILVNGVAKKVLVNLNDREEMTYKLLLGRNYLKNDFFIIIK